MIVEALSDARATFVCLALALIVCGCTSSIPASEGDPNVAETTFRYQFEHNASGQKTAASAYCIGFGSESAGGAKYEDPSQEFLRRFVDVTPRVKAYSQCSRSVQRGVVDKLSGWSALIFRIESIKCADASHCQVEGGYYEGMESASGNTYYLEKRDGKWTVVKDIMHWIS